MKPSTLYWMQQESLLVERQPPARPLSYDAMRQMDRLKNYLPTKYRQSNCHITNFLFPLFSSEIFSLRYAHFMQITIKHGIIYENHSRDVGGWNTWTVHNSTQALFKGNVLRTLGWNRRMVHIYDYVNTTSTQSTDNLYRHPSAGMKQESKGKTGFIFVPQIPLPSVLQNRYQGL